MLLNYQQTKVKAGRIRKYQAILPNKREETIIAQKTKKSSSDKAQKIQWHPAFYAAAELELKENIEELDLISEYHLSKEPIRIDLLIIKEENADKVMKNEIGHIMRKYNVLEYKGPGDELSIDTLYKTLGYACLYKGYGKTINEIPADELTVSLFREAYPQKLFWELERKGYVLEEKYPGIYYVRGNILFPVQIVVISRLNRTMHSSLRILSANADIEDIRKFLEQTENMKTPRERNNIDAVLQASVSANYEIYQKVRRANGMCEALRELMKDEIEQDVARGEARGEMRGRVEGIVDTCCDLGLPEDAILERLQKKLNISLQTAQEYLKNMGKRLRKIRKENALSQDDVADALGICTKQYQRYEYGDSAISCEKLSILEESFHFDVRYIVTGKREQIDIDRYVVNMPWKEKRDFFERMARYVLRILNNTEKGE